MKNVLLISAIGIFTIGAFASESCGLSGSIEDRISDCKTTKLGWDLVTRTEENTEVWRDTSSGLIWGDRLSKSDYTFDQANAPDACHGNAIENGNLGGNFKLPTLEQFMIADKNVIRLVLPNMNDYFWTSSVFSVDKSNAWLFGGSKLSNSMFEVAARHHSVKYSVRCVRSL